VWLPAPFFNTIKLTTMYRASTLKTGLFGRWGWRQHHDASEFQLGAPLVASANGQYFQDVHPLLTLDNIKAIAPDFDGTEAEVAAKFDAWLTNKTQASILKAIRSFWDEKMVEKTAANILESRALFNGAGRLADTIPNNGKIVGFEIIPIRSKGTTVRIDSIGLQFNGAGLVDLYLFHSSRKEPIQHLPLTRTRAEGMEWFNQSGLYLPYISEDKDAGGSWYMVYVQPDGPGGTKAINRELDWSKKSVNADLRDQPATTLSWSRYLEVHPMSTAHNWGATPELWDITDNAYTYDANYGINLQFTVECDITEVILEQQNIFDNVIGLQVAADMLREFAYNPNFNINRVGANLSKPEILYEIDGDSQGTRDSGLSHELRVALEAVKLDVSSLSRVCFPRNNRGLRYRSIG